MNIALAGTDANPAAAGYDSDLSAELYITNGDTTDHAHTAYGTLSFTPELATCQTATTYVDDDEFGPTYCSDEGRSGFEFPDSERLVQFEFEKNLDFALAIAESADDPADPESPVGTPQRRTSWSTGSRRATAHPRRCCQTTPTSTTSVGTSGSAAEAGRRRGGL